jgi:UDP-2-acetamido-3-amino-2,3-dideoxy-glucuronate N-acetyltransferase
MVAAGAVVTKSIPDYAIAAGVPARVTGWMCECGGALKFKRSSLAQCPSCRRKYKKTANTVKPVK